MFVQAHIILVGLAIAAILMSGHMALFGRPLSFMVRPANVVAGVIYGLTLAFAGPAILLRNSWRGRRIEGRPVGFVLAGGLIAVGWSFFSGLVVLAGVDEVARLAVVPT